MVWVDANVAGKVTTLEAETWKTLIKMIEGFIRSYPDNLISWGDLMFDTPRMRMTREWRYEAVGGIGDMDDGRIIG